VRLNTRSLPGFFERLRAVHSEADFAASRYGPAGETWAWRDGMAPFYKDIYQCVFSFVMLSGRAIDHLCERRQSMSRAYEALPAAQRARWPNDEVYCATELSNAGFVCHDLNIDGARFYTRETFKVTPPISLRRLATSAPDELIYHPVETGTAFKAKWDKLVENERRKKRSPEEIGRMFDETALGDLELECGSDARSAFTSELTAA
jgi:hypothetical protein